MSLLYSEDLRTVGALYLGRVKLSLCGMACNHNLKVLPLIVPSVFHRAKGEQYTLMMNKFPGVQVAANILRHYKAMLHHIASLIRHWKEEIPWPEFEANVTTAGGFPVFIGCISAQRSTMTASRVSDFALSQKNPTFLATVPTRGHDKLMPTGFDANVSSLFNGSYLFHSYNSTIRTQSPQGVSANSQ